MSQEPQAEGAGGLFARVRGIVSLPADNQLARFISMNLLGQGGSLVIGFFASIALARLLGPSGRGLLGLMSSVSTLVIIFVSVGLPTAVTYFSSLPDADPSAILGNCLAFAAVLAIILIPASWLLHHQIADAVGHGAGGLTWVLVAALVVISLLDWTTNSQLQGALHFARANAAVVLSRLGYAVAIAVLLGVLGLGVAGGVIALLIGSLLMVMVSLRPLVERGRPRLDLRLMKRLLAYGSRAQVGSILQLANGRLDVIILQIYRPLSQVGYYIVAQSISELVATLANEFRWTSMVLVTRQDGEEHQATTTADAVRHYTLIAGVAALADAFFGSALILLGYGSGFRAAIVPMLILLPGVWMLGIGIVIQGDLSGRRRPGLASGLAGISAAVTTGLDFVLIPSLGAVGAAVASLVGYSVLGIVSIIALHRVTGIAVRALVVPTQADLSSYWRFIAARLGLLRRLFR